MSKRDSLQCNVQDFLVGKQAAFDGIQEGLNNLIKACFTDTQDTCRVRLGVSLAVK